MRRRSSIALSGLVPGRRSSSSSTTSRDDLIKDIFHVGLVNLGNSCFYNTIVQSLSATLPLTDIIAEAPATSPALQALSPASASYNPDVESLPSPIPMTAALLVLLGKLDPLSDSDGATALGKKVFNPKGLLRQLSIKYNEYAEATQQDSHELLRHLIDGIMMEEQDLIKKIQAAEKDQKKRPAQDRTETVRGTMPQSQEGQEHAHNGAVAVTDEVDGDESDESSGSSSSDSSSSDDDSDVEVHELDKHGSVKPNRRPFVGSIFEGKLASFIICDECKNVSLTKEDFMDLSLSLKDESGTRMRKRDRVRRALQSSFSRKKQGSDSASSDNNSNKEELYRRTSLSENEASASQSEADETDEEKIRPLSGGKPRSRHNSLDPTRLSRSTLKPPENRHSSSARSSRDPSPLGRALSHLSQGSNGSRHHHFHRHGKGKIPRPTPEQVAYIRRVLVDVPGPTPALPPGLRVSRPPGQTPSTDSLSSIASSSSSSATRRNLEVDWQNTDLFECFRQFTSVEVLEGENSFACRNCWKCLNPELEIKHKEEKMQRRMQRRTARALKKGEKKRVEDGAESEGAADETAKNSPVTRPVQLPDITTQDLDLETAPASTTPANPTTLPPAQHPRRNFSVSTVVSSHPSLVSSEGGDVSENALDTATEDEDDEFSVKDLNGDADSLTGGPAIDAPQLPLTAENIKVVEANMGELSIAGTAAGGPTAHPIQPPSIATAATHKSSIPPTSTGTAPASASAPVASAQAPLGKAPPKAQRQILRRAHKRYLISPAELPPVLVIHLKRFMQTSKSSLFGSAFVNLKKRDDPVSFPKEMDLTPFLAPRGKPPKNPWVEEIDQAHKAHWKHWGHCAKKSTKGDEVASDNSSSVATPPRDGPETIELEKENQDTKYRLYAVVVHFGTIDTGHYAAYVLSNRYGKGEKAGQGERKWFFTSDEDVRYVSEAEVLKSKAYMLFYERVPSSPSPPRPDVNSQPSQDAVIPATLHEEGEHATNGSVPATLSPEQIAQDAKLAKM